MRLFDSHFHYGANSEESPEEFYRRISPDGNLYLMAEGGDFAESINVKEFAAKVKQSCYAAGVHPQSAGEYLKNPQDFSEFKDTLKLKAIGEIGLDYFYESASRPAQKQVFEQFLALAQEWKLPAVVHCRDWEGRFDAYEDAYARLRDFAGSGGRFELHCFTGTAEWAEKFLALGAYLGVTGMVTFKKAQNIRDLLKNIPLDRLLLETDSPYLAPIPHRGEVNNPGFLVHVAEKVAQELGMEREKIAEITFKNTLDFFKIDLDIENCQ